MLQRSDSGSQMFAKRLFRVKRAPLAVWNNVPVECFVDLAETGAVPVGGVSHGMKQSLASRGRMLAAANPASARRRSGNRD
jgi:hypothetical protein